MTSDDLRRQAIASLNQLSQDELRLAAAWLARLETGQGEEGGAWGQILGVRFILMKEGVCRAELDLGPELWNPHHVLHGSIAHTLIDFTMGGAVVSVIPAGQRPTTIEIKVTYLRPVKEGLLAAESRVIHRGKHVCFLESAVSSPEIGLVATGSGSFYVS